MKKETTIILAAGPINYSNLPIGTVQSNAMIPINGKPVIGWILDDLIGKEIRNVTLVLREEDHHFQEFVRWAYKDRIDLVLVPIKVQGSIVHSLLAGLEQSVSEGPLRIILGDTLIRDSYHAEEDFLYVRNVDDSRRWCIAQVDSEGRVQNFVDKRENVPLPRLALCGYYHIMDIAKLRRSVELALRDGGAELSDVLSRYAEMCPLKIRKVEDWFDFGHIDNLVDARRRLLQSRYFNSLSINPVLNTITKVSEHDEKLRNELDWYLKIPAELKILSPRILSHSEKDGSIEVTQEYYGYPTLAELYVYGDLHAETWISILRHLLRIHAEFGRHSGELEPHHIRSVYLDKTWDRLETLRKDEALWSSLLDEPFLTFNGKRLRNVSVLGDEIGEMVEKLVESTSISVIHGDFCFSNILYDLHNHIVRLIDPRGHFGKKGIYGDPRYDIAKLRHSITGLYDFIVSDLFEIEKTKDGFTGQIYVNGAPKSVGPMFDSLITEQGYRTEEIKFIEALLFISMVPLHKNHTKRQLMMYFTGLTRLNEVLG